MTAGRTDDESRLTDHRVSLTRRKPEKITLICSSRSPPPHSETAFPGSPLRSARPYQPKCSVSELDPNSASLQPPARYSPLSHRGITVSSFILVLRRLSKTSWLQKPSGAKILMRVFCLHPLTHFSFRFPCKARVNTGGRQSTQTLLAPKISGRGGGKQVCCWLKPAGGTWMLFQDGEQRLTTLLTDFKSGKTDLMHPSTIATTKHSKRKQAAIDT